MNCRIFSYDSYLLAVNGRFMDIYSFDTVKTLEKHSLLSSKNPKCFEIFCKSTSDFYNDIVRDID